MTVYVRSKYDTIDCDKVDSWSIDHLFGTSNTYGINAHFKGRGFFGRSESKRIGQYPSKTEAEIVLNAILNEIVEADKKGGGIVSLI